MTDDRKTDPTELHASTVPPGLMTDADIMREILRRTRDNGHALSVLTSELTNARIRLDEVVLDVLPRLAKLESTVESMQSHVKIAEELCDACPLRKAM